MVKKMTTYLQFAAHQTRPSLAQQLILCPQQPNILTRLDYNSLNTDEIKFFDHAVLNVARTF